VYSEKLDLFFSGQVFAAWRKAVLNRWHCHKLKKAT